MKPTTRIPVWKSQSAFGRVEACRVMLHAHGLLSDSENQKVRSRTLKWVRKSGMELVDRGPLASKTFRKVGQFLPSRGSKS